MEEVEAPNTVMRLDHVVSTRYATKLSPHKKQGLTAEYFLSSFTSTALVFRLSLITDPPIDWPLDNETKTIPAGGGISILHVTLRSSSQTRLDSPSAAIRARHYADHLCGPARRDIEAACGYCFRSGDHAGS